MQAVAVFYKRLRGTWTLTAGSNSVVKLLGGRGTFGMVSSSWLAALVQAVAVFKSDCEVLGLC